MSITVIDSGHSQRHSLSNIGSSVWTRCLHSRVPGPLGLDTSILPNGNPTRSNEDVSDCGVRSSCCVSRGDGLGRLMRLLADERARESELHDLAVELRFAPSTAVGCCRNGSMEIGSVGLGVTMALNALEEERLKSIAAPKHLSSNKQHYKTMASDAYAYTAKVLKATGQKPRPDDVSEHLESAVGLDPKLQVFLQKARAHQQYWKKWFTYLILDTLWKELENDYSDG